MTETPTYYTVNEVADLLRVHQRTVRKWLDAGKLERVKAGGRVLIPSASVDAMIQASTPSTSDNRPYGN